MMDAFTATIAMPLDVAEPLVRGALSDAGFGVLTEIDVAATLRAKLGVERQPLKILGACNPSFANRALDIDPSVALMLPCNVVLAEPAPGQTTISIADPRAMMSKSSLTELAAEAADRLMEVVSALGGRV